MIYRHDASASAAASSSILLPPRSQSLARCLPPLRRRQRRGRLLQHRLTSQRPTGRGSRASTPSAQLIAPRQRRHDADRAPRGETDPPQRRRGDGGRANRARLCERGRGEASAVCDQKDAVTVFEPIRASLLSPRYIPSAVRVKRAAMHAGRLGRCARGERRGSRFRRRPPPRLRRSGRCPRRNPAGRCRCTGRIAGKAPWRRQWSTRSRRAGGRGRARLR